MKQIACAVGALAVTAGSVMAGGVERTVTSPAILFEDGDYFEFSYGHVSPSVSGTQAVTIPVAPGLAFPAGASSRDMSESYTAFSLSLKKQLGDRLHLGLILDQPIGADVKYKPYDGNPTGPYVYGGSSAKILSSAVTTLLRYQVNDNVSLYGGLKLEQASGKVALFNGYTMSTSKETDLGYIVGAAYEKPEIALRVALTYASAITHDFDVTENGAPSLPFETEVPQSINLDFQTGVAKDTLVFGAVRWREWSAFDITPVGLLAATGESLVEYDDDTITYTLGVGRRFSDHWSGAVQVTHEPATGGFAGNLGPTDGYTSLGLGVTYTQGKMKISGGMSYAKIGSAKTEASAPFLPGTTLGDFRDNDALAFGVKVGFNF